ncbi:hypothetical protein [Haloarcula litorea]|uniref:hypothetical protein n=1 Tax=Haloarcula litorea TaxID=3032579 RepID=UPI0023E7650B|nr:hypothetical protein [Halomicroarcula sp. GDY20]
MRSPLAALRQIQRSPRKRWAATLGAALVGLGLAGVHWLGLVAGGALVGCCWPSLRSALVAGLGFGVVAVLGFLVQMVLAGSLAGVLGMGVLTAVAVATPLVAGPFGALARGLLPE